MEWDAFLASKKIDSEAFQKNEPALWSEWKALFEQMHPKSFVAQKLYLINPIRKKYLLQEEVGTAVVAKKPARPAVKTAKPNLQAKPNINPAKPKLQAKPKMNPVKPKLQVKPKIDPTEPGEQVKPKVDTAKPKLKVKPKINPVEPGPGTKPKVVPVKPIIKRPKTD